MTASFYQEGSGLFLKMKSRVYFIGVTNLADKDTIKQRLARLLNESRLLDFISLHDEVAVKIHFGEEANTGYVRPEYARLVCDNIAKRQASAFLADTNTLYRGKRMKSADHLKLAYEHGFSQNVAGVPIVIPDDTKKENTTEVSINQKFIKVAKIATPFLRVDAIIGIAHFKGHMMTGFGGALKNIGMGCATREGKLALHSGVSPVVRNRNCVGCGECEKVCPVNAIAIKNKKSNINSLKCIGCASCLAACVYNAIDVDWEAGGSDIQEKMVEYAHAVLKDRLSRLAFLNFAIKITKECDCLAKDDPRIAPDVGILASKDPVSIDKASMDLVNKACGKDIFKAAHPERDGLKQLIHASKLGLGSLDYELVVLS